MKLFFAPLQGYTDYVFRNAHHAVVGGVDAYFMPFLRWDGGLRNKDRCDVSADNNSGTPVVPQVIAAGCDELSPLLDAVQAEGFRRVDLNLGCPFPLQTGRGRGAALLASPDRVRAMMDELKSRAELSVSVKMRCGFVEKAEGLEILELLNNYKLAFVTIHPRLGKQQYKGTADMDAFSAMLHCSRHPVVYNGDLRSVADIGNVMSAFPDLYGVMIGRGLLARPTLGVEWRSGLPMDDGAALRQSLRLHDVIYDTACRTLQGDHQVLERMRAYWEYQKPLVDKKVYKRLMKSGTLSNYEAAVAEL